MQALTTGDVAKLCGVHFRTVIRWIKNGRLKAYQLPGRGDNRIEVDDLLSFLRVNDMPIPKEISNRLTKVLVVDDELSVANSIKRVLKNKDYDVYIAGNGFQAGALLGAIMPTVVTLDIQMAGINGIEVIQFIKSIEHLQNVKILVVSAARDELIKIALDAGADDFLQKPFNNEELLEKIQKLSGLKFIRNNNYTTPF